MCWITTLADTSDLGELLLDLPRWFKLRLSQYPSSKNIVVSVATQKNMKSSPMDGRVRVFGDIWDTGRVVEEAKKESKVVFEHVKE
jgi:hypothetical protein